MVDAEDRENEGRLHLRRRKSHARDRQFHDHARPRAGLHADAARGLRAAEAGARWSRRTRRRWARRSPMPVDHRTCQDRHHGAGTGRRRSARSSIPAASRAISSGPGTCFRWWPRKGRAAPRRPYRGGGRPGAAGRTCSRPACCAKSSTTRRRTGRSQRSCSTWPASTTCEIISIEELIRYRRRSEKLVYRIAEAELPTRYGEFKMIAYGVKYESQQPIVLVMGDLTKWPRRWCGCTRRASPATCSIRCAAIAATNCTWRWK